VQVGVGIDMKDYLSTIISSLLCSLSSFALVQLTAARMHALLKMIEPDVLLPLLIEGADERQEEALAVGEDCQGLEKEEEGRISDAEVVRKCVTYCYIIAPACDSNCSRSIHSPLHGPNSQCASLLPVTLLFRSFPLSLHMHYVIVPIRFHYPVLLLYTAPLYLVS